MLKVTIITVCYNSAATISSCINSVLSQDYRNIEYIIIDGGSSDTTTDIIESYGNQVDVEIRSDSGIYDAMNKGVKAASGEIIAFLNSDDFYPDSNIVTKVVSCFNQNVDFVYGDVEFVNDNLTTSRIWRVENGVRSQFDTLKYPIQRYFSKRLF